MLRQHVTPKIAIILLLVVVYTVVLVALVASSREETVLAARVTQAGQTLAQGLSNRGNDPVALRSSLATARDRLGLLEARVPRELQDGVFDHVAEQAQRSGVEVSYQRKAEFPEALQAGTYKVYRFAIAARGGKEALMAFLENLQKDSSQTMLVENVSLNASGQEWQLSVEVVVYTTGQ